MKTIMTIKIDRLAAFRAIRKGGAGKARLGSFSFRDKTKYSRKGCNTKNW